MPRGIPKDPNHPRNKKRLDTAGPAATPKRRGRPPGSGKKAAVEATPEKKAATPKKDLNVGVFKGIDTANTIRQNIHTIAEAIHLTGAIELKPALIGQVSELLRLSAPEPQTADSDEDESEPVVAAPTAAPALVPVPNNNLPTPPSFVPPPYPPHTTAQ